MADALAQSSQREPCQTRQRNALKADITAGPNLHWLEPKYILHRDRPGMHVMKATGPTFNDSQANYCTEPLINHLTTTIINCNTPAMSHRITHQPLQRNQQARAFRLGATRRGILKI